MEEEKKNWFLQWMEKPWIRTIAIILVISMITGIAGHGIYLRKMNRKYAEAEAARLKQEQLDQRRQADFDAAYENVRKAIEEKDYASAIEKLEACLALADPGSTVETELLTTRASLNILLGNSEEAKSDLDQAALGDENSPVILLLKSQIEVEQENYDTAQSDMEKYLELEPDNYDVRLSLTQLYEMTGQYSAAAESYMALQKLRPTDKSIEINAGRCLILAQRLTEAQAILEPILENQDSPEIGTAYFLRAMIRMQNSDFSGAIEDYTDAIEGGYDARVCLEQITACAFVLGDHNAVLECEKSYLALWPEGSSAASFYQQVGISAMTLKNYDHAEKSLTRSLDLNPEYPGTYYYRALTRFSGSQWELAAEDFSSSISHNYMADNSYYNRGLCYAQMKDLENACADLEKASQGEDQEIVEAAKLLLPEIQKGLNP